MLDVLLVDKVSLPMVPGLIGKYKNGRYKELSHLVRHYKTRELKIFCDKEVPVNVDGEALFARDVELAIAQEQLRFFYPRGLSFAAKETAEV
jgi:diacylglycerol kinase family enzyme